MPVRKKYFFFFLILQVNTPVFLPGEVHGQMSLVGYSPWGHKEWDGTERLALSVCFQTPRPKAGEHSSCCRDSTPAALGDGYKWPFLLN